MSKQKKQQQQQQRKEQARQAASSKRDARQALKVMNDPTSVNMFPLPWEVSQLILQSLDFQELLKMREVCKTWRTKLPRNILPSMFSKAYSDFQSFKVSQPQFPSEVVNWVHEWTGFSKTTIDHKDDDINIIADATDERGSKLSVQYIFHSKQGKKDQSDGTLIAIKFPQSQIVFWYVALIYTIGHESILHKVLEFICDKNLWKFHKSGSLLRYYPEYQPYMAKKSAGLIFVELFNFVPNHWPGSHQRSSDFNGISSKYAYQL